MSSTILSIVIIRRNFIVFYNNGCYISITVAPYMELADLVYCRKEKTPSRVVVCGGCF